MNPLLTLNSSSKKKMIFTGSALIAVVLIFSIWKISHPSYHGIVSGNGRIEATEIDIAAKLAGRLEKIHVEEGDFVEPGQILAEMQIDTLQAQLAEAEAIAVQREAELDAAERRLARTEKLSKEGASSMQELDDDRASKRGAIAALNASKATIERIRADIKDSQLISPCIGRVQYLIAREEEVLGAGGKVMNIVKLTDVYMTFFLPEKIVGKLSMGAEARIVLDAFPEFVIPAKITYVSSTAQFTPKTVETATERQKLMFRVKANFYSEKLRQHLKLVKTGLPGVAWIKLESEAEWPKHLNVRVPE